jgi:multiple sugar transport system permease protein/raffinose/stachyose/melibiose transport system permease protein
MSRSHTVVARNRATLPSAGASGQREGRVGAAHPGGFLTPAFLVLGLFFFAPTIYNFVYAFTDWSSFKSEINPVGLDNFADLLKSDTLGNSIKVTIVYSALVALFQNCIGLGLALLLERDTRLNRFARAAFFIPVLMSALAVGYVFRALLKTDGVVNTFLAQVFGEGASVPFLDSRTWTIVVVALIHAWKWCGMSMLIFLAGLKGIDSDLQEAAAIDGANHWQLFTKIKIPLLAPAFTFNVATALLGSMNSFDIVQAMTGGGPARSTELVNIFIFRTFGQGLFAQATTMSLVLFFLIAALAFPVIRALRKREEVL